MNRGWQNMDVRDVESCINGSKGSVIMFDLNVGNLRSFTAAFVLTKHTEKKISTGIVFYCTKWVHTRSSAEYVQYGGHKMKMGRESVMMCFWDEWSCSYPISLLTLVVKSKLSTLPQYQSSQMDVIFCRFIPLSVLQTVSLCSVLMLLFCPSLPKRFSHQNCPYVFPHLKYVSSVL